MAADGARTDSLVAEQEIIANIGQLDLSQSGAHEILKCLYLIPYV